MHINRKRQSDSEPALTDEAQTNAQEARSPRSPLQYSVQRVALACFGVLGTLGLLALAACPANLENPGQVIAQTTGTAGNVGTAGTGGAPFVDTVDVTCVTALFKKNCTTVGCHQSPTAAIPSAADLDLQSPGVAARLVDVNATHGLTTGPCPAAKLIDSANPTMSWLLTKLQNKQGDACGSGMPVGPMLTSDETTCITTFINAEAAEHAGAGTGTAGAGTGTAGAAAAGASSGGSGGASAGSGGM